MVHINRIVLRAGVATLLITTAALLPMSLALAQTNPLTQSHQGETAVPPSAEAGELPEAQAVSPDANEIIRSLAPFADGNPNAPSDIRDVDADGKKKVRVNYGRAIDLTVFFEYDSAVLTPEARIQLEPLGQALRSRDLAPYRFLIAGHTDAAGDPDYNNVLSERRAHAVRSYLTSVYGIDPARLLTRGWGAARLKTPSMPLSGVNRRVEVALIAPARQSPRSDASDLDESYIVAAPQDVPADDAHDWQILGPTACNTTGLVDPRRMASNELDDFHSAPTSLCELRAEQRGLAFRARPNEWRRWHWYDPQY
jgi:outer membrane protein OmpA-like peptidoglycan-associated protein